MVLPMHGTSCLCKVNINRVYSFCMDSAHLLVGPSKHPMSVGEFSLFNLVGSNWLIRWASAVDIRWSLLICLVSVSRVGEISIKPPGNDTDRRLSSPSSVAFIFNNRSVSLHNVVSRADRWSTRNGPMRDLLRWSSYNRESSQSVSSVVPRTWSGLFQFCHWWFWWNESWGKENSLCFAVRSHMDSVRLDSTEERWVLRWLLWCRELGNWVASCQIFIDVRIL